MPKIRRNAKCPCNSGKKYKKCCLEKDKLEEDKLYTTGQETTSETLKEVREYLSTFDKEVIDITNKLTRDTYVNFQRTNQEVDRIMIAENVMRNSGISFGNSTPYIMVMQKGLYCNFDHANFEQMKPTLERLAKEDLQDFQCDKCDGHVGSPAIQCNTCEKRACIPCIKDLQSNTTINITNNLFQLTCPSCEEEKGLQFSAARVSDF